MTDKADSRETIVAEVGCAETGRWQVTGKAEGSRETIVAEVSKNWPETVPDDYPRFLSERFEVVIEANRRKGYRLDSWQLSRIPHVDGGCNETIVAVFTRPQ